MIEDEILTILDLCDQHQISEEDQSLLIDSGYFSRLISGPYGSTNNIRHASYGVHVLSKPSLDQQKRERMPELIDESNPSYEEHRPFQKIKSYEK